MPARPAIRRMVKSLFKIPKRPYEASFLRKQESSDFPQKS